MLSYIQKMLPYEKWANLKVIAILEENDTSNINLMMHIEAAKHIWLCRMLDKKKRELRVFPEDGTLELIRFWHEKNHQEMQDFIANQSNESLQTEIEYFNSERKFFKSTIEDILLQLLNHGTYHRAQIARNMALANKKPAATDYIFYRREGN